MNLKSFIERILNEDKSLTKYQIAKDLGCSASLVLGWANGTRTRCFRSMKQRIEAKYNIELDDEVLAKHKRGVWWYDDIWYIINRWVTKILFGVSYGA